MASLNYNSMSATLRNETFEFQHGLGYTGLPSMGSYELEKHTQRRSTKNILSNNMHVKAPILKRSVKLSSRVIFCLYGIV